MQVYSLLGTQKLATGALWGVGGQLEGGTSALRQLRRAGAGAVGHEGQRKELTFCTTAVGTIHTVAHRGWTVPT